MEGVRVRSKTLRYRAREGERLCRFCKIVKWLKASVKGGKNPFVTYAQFARTVGQSDKYPPAWANKDTLDEAARILKSDQQVALPDG
jgi:hypothetical protein